MKHFVVITADDFGIASPTNAAIEAAHRDGVLTSASVMTNMPAFSEAVTIARRNPQLGVGVHLTLTSGRPVLPPDEVPLLVDASGRFRHGYVSLSRLMLGPSRTEALEQIRAELSAQVGKAISAGLDLDHLDGHRHVQMIPGIWPIVQRLAAEHGGLVVRLSRERPDWERAHRARVSNLIKTAVLHACAQANQAVPRPVHVVGVMDSGCVNVRAIRLMLRRLTAGVTEIVTHPSMPLPARAGLCCSADDELFLRASGRVSEFSALINPKVRQMFKERSIEPITFRTLGTRETSRLHHLATC